MPYFVEIRRVADGAVRNYEDECDWQEGSDSLWSDGNFSCDCNRSLFFARAAGEPDPDEDICGENGYYVRITDKDGRELYVDEHFKMRAFLPKP